MAQENGFSCDLNNHRAISSQTQSPEVKNETVGTKEDHQPVKSSKREDKGANAVPYYKLFSFADSKDVLLMVFGTIASVGNGMTMPLMTLLIGEMINAFGLNQNNTNTLRAVSKVSVKFVHLAIGAGVTSFFQVTCWMVTGERQASRMRSLYLQTILRQDIGFFDTETSSGEVVERMSGDTVLIQDAMGEKDGKFIQLLTTSIGGFVIAFIKGLLISTKGWLLSLVMLSSIPALAISGAVMTITVSKMASRGQNAYSQAANIVEQTMGSIRTVASFTGEKRAIAQYDKSLNMAYKSGVQEGLALGLGVGAVMFIIFSSYGLAVWFGGKMIIEKGYTGGDVLNILIAVMSGSMSLGQASPCVTSFVTGKAAAFKMFEIINRKSEIDFYDTNGRVLNEIRGDIEFSGVCFSYPARPDEQIFNGLSLFISSGTTYALVGETGSGKSTVISLIERFYDPQAGEIFIDGTNLKEFQLRWIRSKIGIVSQEPVLFSSSIKDNISYGKDGASEEEIKSASRIANAMTFIDKLPQGLDTQVGEHGTKLSGGQKQRIAIARSILRDPRILLLDEATSALDAESEHIVQEALDRIMVSRTTVIVAHRLSTVQNADKISVIHRGKIVETGSHLELLRSPDGAYSQFIRLQGLSVDNANNVNIKCRSFGRSISEGSSEFEKSNGEPFSALITVPTKHMQETMSENPESTTQHIGRSREVPLHRLAFLNKPEIPVLLLGLLFSVVAGVLFPVFSILLSSVVKTFFEPKEELQKDSRFWAFMFLVLGLVSLAVHPAKTYFFSVAGCRLIQRIRSLCFKKVVHMEINWFDEPDHSSGSIGSRLSADAATVCSLVGDALALLVQNAASVVAGLAIAFEANWILAFIILGLIPLIALNGIVQMKFMKGFSADAKPMYEEASQVASDAVGSIRTVASFGAEDRVIQLYKRKCEVPMKVGIRLGVLSGTGFGVSNFLLYCVYATCCYAGARLVDDGRTTFVKVFRVLFALTMTAIAISRTSALSPDSSKASTSTASIFKILDRKSVIDSSEDSGVTLENIKGDIEIRHISFKYPTRPDVQIFTDFSLDICYGKTVALVGESGSGKSTVISLLLRFYDPDVGHITLDGVDLNKFQLRWMRQQMGLVSQEPVLFNDTIRANIAYGKEGVATEAEICDAAKLANALNFISGLQQGLDTLVGERGIQLSGGQKQRVAIARAIVKSPQILLLDEATSALDAESEKVVQDALDRVMVNRTSVVVAHRLSTIKNADVIAVVKNGVIAEKGRHDSLLNIENGVYASLVQLHTATSS